MNRMRKETIRCLNDELRYMNTSGMVNIECWKSNFDVEIGTDMRIALSQGADSFCLFS